MTTTSPVKKLGIWMDHSSAHIMELSSSPVETKIIESKFTRKGKEDSLSKGENLMHNKEQHQLSEYYKELGAVIKNHTEVVLFGPTTAKNELANLLKADHNFDKTKVVIKGAGKMTGIQIHAFIRDYFHNAI